MLSRTFLGVLIALTAASGASSRFVPDAPPATRVDESPEKREAATTSSTPAQTVSADPWQCATENVTQYFANVPQPTGDVLDGINSYGDEVAKPCMATATGFDMFSCTVSDPKSWCGFTTAAHDNVLSSYSTYVSAAVSFWTENSETISALSTSCPVAWARPDLVQHEWLKIATAHAYCFLKDHPVTGTTVSAPTSTTSSGSASTTSSDASSSEPSSGAASRGQALETLALMAMGLVVLANAA